MNCRELRTSTDGRTSLPRRFATAGAVTMALALAQTAGPGAASAAESSPGDGEGAGVELVQERTAHSRTIERGDGSRSTRISSVPLNYKAPDGSWARIDDRFERQADGTLRNRANSFRVTLPDDAAGTIRVSSAGRAIAFSALGANARTHVTQASRTAAYNESFPGVTTSYQVAGDRLKETLRLASPAVPSSYRFAFDAPGLRPESRRDGSVAFVDDGGRERFRLQPPWMADAAGDLSRALRFTVAARAGDSSTIMLTLDRSWLDDAERRFPVVVDPTISAGQLQAFPTEICEITGDPSSSSGNISNLCDPALDPVVGKEVSGDVVHRALVQLNDVDAILPRSSIVLGARMEFVWGDPSAQPGPLDLHALTSSFTDAATWERTGVAPWTRGGGDFRPTATSRVAFDASPVASLGLPHLVQEWIEGRTTNAGVIVKAASETTGGVTPLRAISFLIDYEPRAGFDSQYTYDAVDLPGIGDLAVDLADGNLLLSTHDIYLPGTTGDLSLTRTWNSQGVSAWNTFGRSWSTHDTTPRLTRNDDDGSYVLTGPDGFDGVFARKADGTYASALGFDASLIEQPDGTVRIDHADSGERWTFDNAAPHRLVTVTAADGYTTTRTYAPGHGPDGLTSLSDSDGRTLTFAYTAGGDLSTITDGTSTWRYQFDANHNLTSVTTPSSGVLRYDLDSSERITTVHAEDGSTATIGYDGRNRVTSIARADSAGTPIGTLAYAYGPATAPACGSPSEAMTTVTQGVTTRVYCLDASDHLVDATAPPAPGDFSAYVDDDPAPGATVTWEQAPDTAGAADHPGIGVTRWHYRYRLASSSSWSPWAATSDDSFQILSATPGQQYAIELTAEDGRGNVSTTASATVTVADFRSIWLNALDREIEGENDAEITGDEPEPLPLAPLAANPDQACNGRNIKRNMLFGIQVNRRYETGPIVQYGWEFVPRAVTRLIANGVVLAWSMRGYVNGVNQGGPAYPLGEASPGKTVHGYIKKVHARSKRGGSRYLRFGDRIRIVGTVRGHSVLRNNNTRVEGAENFECLVTAITP